MHSQIVFLAQTVPSGRVFGLDLQTLISIGIQLVNGIILAAALGFILYKPVKEFMRKRTEGIQSKIEDTDATMVKAQELIAEYDIKIKDIDKERIKILEAARLKAADEGKLILEEAKKEASEIKKRSMDSVLADKKRLQEETRLYIIEMASFMAEKYITQKIDNETQDKVFEEALAQMEIAQW
ncbi:ATP synthase F0 subunit B [Faecalicatena contorta]|uniref:ATP synthase subunit b n=1 Tax=Faecalicatena contorta TaxID=39482 RepID=A0A315ZNW0_9FIRM|nr:ATP synthase F0 subunit B [Faecalicatena contorta]PWJ47176.1 ATP synthase F0 subcomplex B subunit [Faecalicatena contorta]SUQ16151.1 ATP synthase F0 subcomplex B subunit [Faecalicatena contorta]